MLKTTDNNKRKYRAINQASIEIWGELYFLFYIFRWNRMDCDATSNGIAFEHLKARPKAGGEGVRFKLCFLFYKN